MKSQEELVTHLFREEYGKLTAILLAKFGAHQLENIEDALQDTLLKAMTLWPFNETPSNPTAWLYKTAYNRILDILKKNSKNVQDSNALQLEARVEVNFDDEIRLDQIEDSQLKMIFACCHPALTLEQQVILSLKLIGGFGNKELAKVLLKKEETVAKSYTRAKKKFKSAVGNLEIPIELGLQSRLNVVLRVIYLLFTEGYKTTMGDTLIKKDVCMEAIRLALLLLKNKYCAHPNVNALIALMCFHAARFDARISKNNELIDLEHQDRSLYNSALIEVGHDHLEQATRNAEYPSNYHYEAAIAYCHSSALTYEETNWKEILEFYNLQLKTILSPQAALNRIVAVSRVHGFAVAQDELNALKHQDVFKPSSLSFAIEAELFEQAGNSSEQRKHLRKAVELSNNPLEIAYWQRKLDNI